MAYVAVGWQVVRRGKQCKVSYMERNIWTTQAKQSNIIIVQERKQLRKKFPVQAKEVEGSHERRGEREREGKMTNN